MSCNTSTMPHGHSLRTLTNGDRRNDKRAPFLRIKRLNCTLQKLRDHNRPRGKVNGRKMIFLIINHQS